MTEINYKEAYEWREMAHNQLLEDYKFMMNQRLGAINAEYDLLNVELQNEKRRVRLMGVYNVVLVVLVALLIVALVLMKRYKRDINVMEIDIEVTAQVDDKYLTNLLVDLIGKNIDDGETETIRFDAAFEKIGEVEVILPTETMTLEEFVLLINKNHHFKPYVE